MGRRAAGEQAPLRPFHLPDDCLGSRWLDYEAFEPAAITVARRTVAANDAR